MNKLLFSAAPLILLQILPSCASDASIEEADEFADTSETAYYCSSEQNMEQVSTSNPLAMPQPTFSGTKQTLEQTIGNFIGDLEEEKKQFDADGLLFEYDCSVGLYDDSFSVGAYGVSSITSRVPCDIDTITERLQDKSYLQNYYRDGGVDTPTSLNFDVRVFRYKYPISWYDNTADKIGYREFSTYSINGNLKDIAPIAHEEQTLRDFESFLYGESTTATTWNDDFHGGVSFGGSDTTVKLELMPHESPSRLLYYIDEHKDAGDATSCDSLWRRRIQYVAEGSEPFKLLPSYSKLNTIEDSKPISIREEIKYKRITENCLSDYEGQICEELPYWILN